MVKKKNDVPEDLMCFKDLLTDEDIKKHHKAKRDSSGNYEIFTFLDRESKRLGKIIELCEDRVHVLKNYPQQELIQKDLEKNLNEKKQEVITSLSLKDSPLTKNLNELLQLHFNS